MVFGDQIPMSTVVKDLETLVSEVETESTVLLAHSNYALLAGPARTIKTLLSRLASSQDDASQSRTQNPNAEPSESTAVIVDHDAGWDLSSYLTHDSETDFWLSLAEHPFLLGTESNSIDWAM